MGGLFHNLRHPRRCYVVCAVARSGSNFLTDGLRATGRAGRPKQFFLPKYEQTYAARSKIATSDFATYIREITAATATSNEIFGFKLMAWYLEDFLQRLRASKVFTGASDSGDLTMLRNAFPRLQFIQIVRQNKVRQAVSKARAEQTGLWKVQEGNFATGEEEFDPKLIASCLEDTRREELIWSRFFERSEIEPFRVIYENLCADYKGTIGAILDFLKIRVPKSTPLEPGTVRQTDAISDEWEERFRAVSSPNELAIF